MQKKKQGDHNTRQRQPTIARVETKEARPATMDEENWQEIGDDDMPVDPPPHDCNEEEAMANVPPPPKFSEALEAISNRAGVGRQFRKCVINVDRLVAATTEEGRAAEGVLDLDFLHELTTTTDFLPPKVFVRREMQAMWTTLGSPHTPKEEQRILVGSPGVGTSVVFFLAALRRAVTYQEKVLYVRKTRQESMSLFFMEKGGDSDDSSAVVNVLFSRTLNKLAHPDLGNLCANLMETSGLDMDEFYIMLDGPCHSDPRSDRLQDAYQALCTSGGFPARPQEAIETQTILVLNGWTESSITSAMVALGIPAEEVAKRYQLCGGRIRLALMEDQAKLQKWFDEVMDACGPEKVPLARTRRGASGTATHSRDWLGTRFYDPETNTTRTIVDSHYVFRQLVSRLDFESNDDVMESYSAVIESYKVATALQRQAVRGWCYEDLLHRWWKRLLPGWIQAHGTGAEGVQQLLQECLAERLNMYWIPSIPQFANIDAAIVVDATLICFQYTVQTQRHFDEDLLWEEIVGKLVRKGVPIDVVKVVFVTPSDVRLQNTHRNCSKKYSIPGIEEGVPTGTTATQKAISFVYSEATVDVDSTTVLDSDFCSLADLLRFPY